MHDKSRLAVLSLHKVVEKLWWTHTVRTLDVQNLKGSEILMLYRAKAVELVKNCNIEVIL